MQRLCRFGGRFSTGKLRERTDGDPVLQRYSNWMGEPRTQSRRGCLKDASNSEVRAPARERRRSMMCLSVDGSYATG